jgi:hypothetical protein
LICQLINDVTPNVVVMRTYVTPNVVVMLMLVTQGLLYKFKFVGKET